MKKKKMIGFRTLLTLLVVLPLALTATALTAVSSIEMKEEMKELYLAQLDGANRMMWEQNRRGEGVESLTFDEATGKITMNGVDVSESLNKEFDEYKKQTDIDCTLFVGDTRRATSLINDKGKRNVGTQATAAVTEAVLGRGEVYSSENTQVAGQAYFVSYLPIKDNSDAILGMFFAGIPRADYQKALQGTIVKNVVIALVIFVALALFVFFFMAKRIADALNRVSTLNTSLSEGDLTKTIDNRRAPAREIGELISSAEELQGKLSEIVTNINSRAKSVAASADELRTAAEHTAENSNSVSNAVGEIATGATSQAEDIQDGMEALMDVTGGIDELNEEIDAVDKSAVEMAESSEDMKNNFGRLSTAMDKTGKSLAEVSESMRSVDGIVDEVRKTMDAISAIAGQTNLLSLNASIEAARAGEAGKGFAVVADNIGQLAKQTKDSSESIDSVMKELSEKTTDAVTTVEELSKIVTEQAEITAETRATVDGVIGSINSVRGALERIKENCGNIEKKCAMMNDTMSSLSAISEQNAASSEETSASMEQVNNTVGDINALAEDLSGISEELTEMLKFFKV